MIKVKFPFIVLLLFLLSSAAGFAADQAILKTLSGKVELNTGGTSWIPAKQGQTIAKGTVISTGFNSNAVVDLGSSEIFLKPLTRIALEDLSTSGNIIKTNLNLRLGRIDADVKTTEGLKHNFTLRTPVSTAAVRGTRFTAGVAMLEVKTGRISYSNKIGQKRSVSGGSSSSVSGGGYTAPESAAEAVVQTFSTLTTTVAETGSGINTTITAPLPAAGGTVTVTWDLNEPPS